MLYFKLLGVGCNACIDGPARVTKGTAGGADHVHSNLDTSTLVNHIVFADVSDHFGTLSKIEGINWKLINKICIIKKQI